MVKPHEALWEIEPHTKAKHEILKRYLGAWFPILGSKIPRIVYIDGFCGPGRYKGGEDGSPVIALKEAIKHQSILYNSEVNFLFIDERADRIAHLKNELSAITTPRNFNVNAVVNEFQNTLTNILDAIEKSGKQLDPTFAFIDPFGFKGAPFTLVERLLNNPRTEIFVNIMIDSVNRFVEHPLPIDRQHIKNLLGASDDEIAQIINSPNRPLAFRQLYQSKLRQRAKYARFFEMMDRRNKVVYCLFFASNHPLGHAKIKEAFWKVDPESGFRFSDNTNPSQLVLFESDPSMGLAEELKNRYVGTTQTTENVFAFVENETPYLLSHAKKALYTLEQNNFISVSPVKNDGKKRRKKTFPNGVIIQF